jgi:hypothetical protein
LNYLVLVLGFLLLDDRFLLPYMPASWKQQCEAPATGTPIPATPTPSDSSAVTLPQGDDGPIAPRLKPHPLAGFKVALTSVVLLWIFYATTAELLWMFWPQMPLPISPVAALEPFRIANRYGLFAVMTRGRYEIEFQGSNDGVNWTPYPFRYKPQNPYEKPRIYAPYQPRFDWNLWFASLGSWRDNIIVVSAEERLLAGAPDVLALFAGNPFPNAPPKEVRAVLWQYWFTTMAEKRATGRWWNQRLLGVYAPVLERQPDGKLVVVQAPDPLPPHS